MNVLTPTSARKNFFSVLRAVKENQEPMQIGTDDEDESIVIMTKSEYRSLIETAYLQENGVLDEVINRMKDATDDDFVEV
ncbi:MAG: type II toxin-antitoxin system Phd/YefM family antitoxin [Lactobacillaceae bacterium]|nr:type II toxin-antitoxin system Phd/YefM family antitoxin [Lactobacillaceae bacterium]